MNNDLVKEFAQKIGCKNIVKQWIIVLCIQVVLLALVFFILDLEKMTVLTKVFFWGMPVYSSFWLFTAPYRYYKMMLKHRKKLGSVLDGHRTVIFGENIAVTEGTSSYAVEYSDITKIIEYKTFYYLFVNNQVGCIVGRNSFGEKTDAEFLDFLHEKCANVKS